MHQQSKSKTSSPIQCILNCISFTFTRSHRTHARIAPRTSILEQSSNNNISNFKNRPVLIEFHKQSTLFSSILRIRVGFRDQPLDTLLLAPKWPPIKKLRKSLLDTLPRLHPQSHK
ncbi:hypothetical protein V8G54_035108 [Vigna mungo]|uniref:Uncharacterized protein n=1 Tax=Vigna mungo TaxID=3915 RepID=A0AAQ3MFY3_VIGMU